MLDKNRKDSRSSPQSPVHYTDTDHWVRGVARQDYRTAMQADLGLLIPHTHRLGAEALQGRRIYISDELTPRTILKTSFPPNRPGFLCLWLNGKIINGEENQSLTLHWPQLSETRVQGILRNLPDTPLILEIPGTSEIPIGYRIKKCYPPHPSSDPVYFTVVESNYNSSSNTSILSLGGIRDGIKQYEEGIFDILLPDLTHPSGPVLWDDGQWERGHSKDETAPRFFVTNTSPNRLFYQVNHHLSPQGTEKTSRITCIKEAGSFYIFYMRDLPLKE